jgi:hypothetical protein
VLQVILPLSFILSSVNMLVNTIAVGFVICPEAVVDVSIYMDELSLTMGSVLSPLTNVLSTVWPLLLSKSISKATFPLSDVNSSSFELIRRTLLTFLIWFVCILSDCFLGLFICKVFAGPNVL